MTTVPAYEVQGPSGAPALVLLNSIGTTRAVWQETARALAGPLRVVRIDAPGHGESTPAPPTGRLTIADLGAGVLAVLDDLGIDRADVAGLSIGGMTAMWLAIEHPERVRRLVTVCSSAQPGRPQAWHDRAAAVRADGMASIADGVLSRWLTPERLAGDPDLVANLRAQLVSTDAESYAQCCEILAALDLRDGLPRVTAPALVVAAAQDEALPPAHSDVIAALVPDALRVDVRPAAHIAVAEAPGRIADLVLRHLGGGLPTAQDGGRTRRAVLGDAHVDRASAAATPFTADFQDFLTRYAWGEVWSRPGLGRRERSIATLAALVALGAENETAMHVRAAVRNGLSRDEIGEVLLHTALYAGLPRANAAFAVAQQVFDDLDAAGGPTVDQSDVGDQG